MAFQRQKLKQLNLLEAKRKIMDLLARRDYSLKELTTRLKARCEPEIVTQALDWARTQNWLPSEEKVQEQVVKALGRRKKGQRAINQKLKQMGLQPVKIEPEIELEHAYEAVQSKWTRGALKGFDFKESQKERARVMRYLASRGFGGDIVQKVLKNYFKVQANDEDIYDEEL